jgi:hypothetical protein
MTAAPAAVSRYNRVLWPVKRNIGLNKIEKATMWAIPASSSFRIRLFKERWFGWLDQINGGLARINRISIFARDALYAAGNKSRNEIDFPVAADPFLSIMLP